MAGKRRRYILTETAEQDFREARGWSLSRWGRALTKQYFADLHECAERIARNSGRFAPMQHVPNTAELSVYPICRPERRLPLVQFVEATKTATTTRFASRFNVRATYR